MVEFGASQPNRLPMRLGKGKVLLRRAMKGILPESILARGKISFGAPADAGELAAAGGELALPRVSNSLQQRAVIIRRSVLAGGTLGDQFGAEPISQSQQHLEVSVVLPCLNEADTLATCIRKAKAALVRDGIAGEIIVADNGSIDGSRQIAVAEGARLVCAGARKNQHSLGCLPTLIGFRAEGEPETGRICNDRKP